MTQTGVVTKLLDKGKAEVAVERVTACGHCSGCGECIYGKRITVAAEKFHCPGSFLMMHRGRPNAEDCRAAADFALAIVNKHK